MFKNLERIHLNHGNPFGGVRKLLITISADSINIKDNSPPEKREAYPRDIEGEEKVKAFLLELSGIDFHNWKNEYIGNKRGNINSWELSFTFTDKEPLIFKGCASGYPEDWNLFLNFISKYSPVMDEYDD